MVNDVADNRRAHPLTTCWFRRRGRVVYVRRESDDVLPRPTRRALVRRASSPRRIREVLPMLCWCARCLFLFAFSCFFLLFFRVYLTLVVILERYN